MISSKNGLMESLRQTAKTLNTMAVDLRTPGLMV